jgi:hypothetical protein
MGQNKTTARKVWAFFAIISVPFSFDLLHESVDSLPRVLDPAEVEALLLI